jgi:hypothetical protein
MTQSEGEAAGPSPSRGVLYVATGERFCRATIGAAESVREHSPELDIHAFCDAAGAELIADDAKRVGFTVGIIEDPHIRSKVDYMGKSPFDHSLFLDVDTRACAPLAEVLDLLGRFDVALSHAHRRNHPNTLQDWTLELPDSFPQFNSGVFAYTKAPTVLALLEEWRRCYQEAGFKKDQVTLRELLWKSDLRIATLPPEYNVRYGRHLKMWQEHPSEAKPRVLHSPSYVEPGPAPSGRRLKRLVKRLRRLAR